MKKTYIVPVTKTFMVKATQMICESLLSAGDTSTGGITSADTKGYNDWDIWGNEMDDYDEE